MTYRELSPEQKREYHRLASKRHRDRLGNVCRRCARPCDEPTKNHRACLDKHNAKIRERRKATP